MPARVTKTKRGYRVSTPNRVHAKNTTKRKAEKQKQLLNAIDHGWKPTGKKSTKRKAKHKQRAQNQ